MYQFLNLRSFGSTQHTLYGSAISLSQLNIYEFPIQAMALLYYVVVKCLGHRTISLPCPLLSTQSAGFYSYTGHG